MHALRLSGGLDSNTLCFLIAVQDWIALHPLMLTDMYWMRAASDSGD